MNCTAMARQRGSGTLSNRFRCFMPVSHEKWLAGTDNGLYCIDPLSWTKDKEGAWKRIDLYDEDGRKRKELSIQYMIMDSKGMVYAATSGDGLLVMEMGEKDVETPKSVLHTKVSGLIPSDVIYTMTKDRNGNIWGFCDNGIFRIHRDSQKRLSSEPSRHIISYLTATAEPLWPSMSLGNALSLDDGRIIKGTRSGIMAFNADSISTPRGRHNLYLRLRYRHNGMEKDCAVGDTVRLPKGVTSCTLYMSLIDYNRLTRVWYGVKKDDDASAWQYTTCDTILLKDIKDGENAITIRSTDGAGTWTEKSRHIIIIGESSSGIAWLIALVTAIMAITATVAIYYRKRKAKSRISPEAIAGIIRGIPTQEDKDNAFKERVENIIVENLSDAEYNTDSLAIHLAMTKASVVGNVKAIYGVTPTELINRIRIQAAEELLIKTDLTVSEIAYRIGYNDPKYFSRVFKRFAGCTPSEARNKVKKQKNTSA